MLWNAKGPYSEAKIVINTRILGDSVSRVMVEVEGNINPTSFDIIEQNKDKFTDDPAILQLLQTAVFRGKEYGYHISAGAEEYVNEESLKRANKKLDYMKKSIIRMHKFVIHYLE